MTQNHPSTAAGAQRATRGYGILEEFLSARRAAMADRLIPAKLRSGAVLDIGCGTTPRFLRMCGFLERSGVDQLVPPGAEQTLAGSDSAIRLKHFDAKHDHRLPYGDSVFDAVTMLAVFEHIPMERLLVLLAEVDRVLKPGGVYVLTTPAGWTGPILTALKLLRLVSPEEIDEHEDSYSPAMIRAIMERTPLGRHPARFGHFELGANVWGIVTKGA
ncbi:MAG: class I SAM-dependent methyltransferase [Phycisphaerales bacterium]